MTPNRKGSTLIELIMTISAGSALLLLAVTMIHQSMTWFEGMGARTQDQRNLQRLAEAWRNDCRDGVAIENRAENVSAIRLSDERRIEYEVQPGMVLRREINETEQEQKISGTEQYAFSSPSRFRFEQLDTPKRARWVWMYQPATGEEPDVVCVVDGVLGGELTEGAGL